MNRGDYLVAHTSVELPDGTEVNASWFFTPGSEPITSGPVEACDPGSGPELSYVEVDGMIKPPYTNRDCTSKLRTLLGDKAFWAAEAHALEIAERYGPDPDDRRDAIKDARLEGE